jgi:signal transduction protein with GAF and PtsI domain
MCYDAIMESTIEQKLAEQEALLQKVLQSTERTRNYMKWSFIIGLAVFIIPLIAMMFAIPAYLKAVDFTSLGL